MKTSIERLLSSTSEATDARVANALNATGFTVTDWWPSDVRVVLDAVRKALDIENALSDEARA